MQRGSLIFSLKYDKCSPRGHCTAANLELYRNKFKINNSGGKLDYFFRHGDIKRRVEVNLQENSIWGRDNPNMMRFILL